jgi:hypothetical protein
MHQIYVLPPPQPTLPASPGLRARLLGLRFVQRARDAFGRASFALLFAALLAGMSHPASAESVFTTQAPTGAFTDGPYELGMKFRSAVGGTVTAIRYWKDPAETAGSHVGHLWDASGVLLATVSFSAETASGWQQQALAAPVTIQANTTYVVSVNSVSTYAATGAGLATAVVNGNLSSVADGGNGVFGNVGVFPSSSFNSTNYFRDVDFQATMAQATQCLKGEKYVSVDGGTTWVRNSVTSNNPVAGANNPLIATVPGANDVPANSVNIPTALFGGTKVLYKFVITNCGNVILYNVRLDDCIDMRSSGAGGFLTGGVGTGGEGNCAQPRMIPASPQRIVAATLAPGQTVTKFSADFPNDYISTVDVCSVYGNARTNGIVRNDSQVEANTDGTITNTGSTFVFFDDLNLVQCKTPPSASIKLLKQISVDNGVTWLDADTTATAPTVTVTSGAQYRFVVTNTGNVTLSNVSISDAALGIPNTVIPNATLTPGQSATIVSGTSGFSSLSQPTRCNANTVGNITNTATVTGTPNTGGANVTDSNPAVLICQPPPPPQCLATSSIESNFNGTQINAGSTIWFNSNFKPSGVTNGTTIAFNASTVKFSSNGTAYTVPVPAAVVTFSSAVTCATMSFNTSLNRWESTVPLNGNVDDIFVSGAAFKVPANFQKGINPVTWSATFSTNTPGVSLNWKWGAAVYTQFPTDLNSLLVKPTHSGACSFNNGDQAGTPESSYKSYVTGGARGGGGSNWTGSWSGTVSGLKLVCP